jgi:UDP-N-acetylglucosamine acyltransferase
MNSIHPTATLIGDVQLGRDNTIGPLAVLIGPVRIGDGNWIGTGVVIGAPPEVRDWPHPQDANNLSSGNGVEIGDRNIIREYVQIHQGWRDVTRLADDTFIMNQTYIAHDCAVENEVTLASSVLLAGHVRISARANLGLGVSVHQGRYVGDGAMIGMGAVVTRDVLPYAKAYGSPARVVGANEVGMQRAGVPEGSISAVAHAFLLEDVEVDRLTKLEGVGQAFDKWRDFHRPDPA